MSIQRIPIHADEDLVFTPLILKDQPDAPTFTLKTVTRLGREEMEYALVAAGLVQHSIEDIRMAYVDELCRLWGYAPDHADIERVKDYWQASDDDAEQRALYETERRAAVEAGEEPPAPLAPYTHPDSEHFDELFARVHDSSPRMRQIRVDNSKWSRTFPRIAIQHCLKGWDGIQTPFNCWDKRPLLDTIVEMEAELVERWGVSGATAYAELSIAAIQRYYLDRSAEKNSKSPAPSPQTPAAMKEAGQAKRRGKSPASEPSEPTPDN